MSPPTILRRRYIRSGRAFSCHSIGAVHKSRGATPRLAVVIFFQADIVAVRRLWRSLLLLDASAARLSMTSALQAHPKDWELSTSAARYWVLRSSSCSLSEICECVVAVLLGGGPPGSASVTRCDSLRIRPLRRALHLTCPSWLPTPAWPASWPDQKPVRSRA
jgi:hypothetical protein